MDNNNLLYSLLVHCCCCCCFPSPRTSCSNAKQQSHQLQQVEPSADECVQKQDEPTTIYSVHSPSRRRGMLFAVSVGSIMVPFTDTICAYTAINCNCRQNSCSCSNSHAVNRCTAATSKSVSAMLRHPPPCPHPSQTFPRCPSSARSSLLLRILSLHLSAFTC